MKHYLFLSLLYFCGSMQASITVVQKKKPFYFRFVPKLKTIKSKKIIVATIDYDHPTLGACTYNMVKDLKKQTFYGWCKTDKIPRKKTTIFELSTDNNPLPDSEQQIELGFNQHKKEMIEAINGKEGKE